MRGFYGGRGLALAFLAALLGSSPLAAQNQRFSVQESLTFGTTLTTARDSARAWLLWNGVNPLALDSAIAFSITGTGASVTGQLSGFPFRVNSLPAQLVPGQPDSLGIRFAPNHNIGHNSEVVICSGALPGCWAIDVRGQGRYAGTYYSATENLSEQALRASLKTILASGYVSLGYNTGRDRMFMDIDNKRVNGEGATVNTVECVYTGRLATAFSNRSAAQSQNFNTEHTMPQSLFGSDNPMQSDLHHLFPTDETANTVRSNNPFDTVANPTNNLPGGSKYGGGKFEPRDVHKGKAARALLYFATRYQDYQGFIAGQEAVLRRWSRNHMPTAQEVKRNDLVQTFQRNRNPYSDHPELLERISSVTAASTVAPQVNTFRYFPQAAQNLTVAMGDTLRVHATVVNTGNQELTLTDPILPSTAWTLEGVQAPPTVAPGDAFNVRIRFVPAAVGRVAGNLTFNALQGSVPGVQVQIPLSVDVLTAVAGSLSGNVRVWPGVFTDAIRYSAAQPSTIVLFDLQGRPLWSAASTTQGTIPTQHLSAGSYLVRVAGPQGVRTFTVVK